MKYIQFKETFINLEQVAFMEYKGGVNGEGQGSAPFPFGQSADSPQTFSLTFSGGASLKFSGDEADEFRTLIEKIPFNTSDQTDSSD